MEVGIAVSLGVGFRSLLVVVLQRVTCRLYACMVSSDAYYRSVTSVLFCPLKSFIVCVAGAPGFAASPT